MTRFVVNSADSHVLEPQDLWQRELPLSLRDRGLRVEPTDRGWECILIDGQEVRREHPIQIKGNRPPGAFSFEGRVKDLDAEGISAEALFPSLGLWLWLIEDKELGFASARVYNEWLLDAYMRRSPRFVGVAILMLSDIDRAIEEARWAAEAGFHGIGLPCTPPTGVMYNDPHYDRLWSALEEIGLPLCFHVGTGSTPVVNRGPGSATTNYLETFVPAQQTIGHLVCSGVLERHPGLQTVFVECGASWLVSLMERMDEGYTQRIELARPKLALLPSDYVRRQVQVTFQHDRAAMLTIGLTGVDSIMWGSDYPHMEGTFPESQKVLDEIFHGIPDDVRTAVSGGNFARVFGLT